MAEDFIFGKPDLKSPATRVSSLRSTGSAFSPALLRRSSSSLFGLVNKLKLAVSFVAESSVDG